MAGEEFSSSGTFKYGFAPRIDNLKEANKGNIVVSGCEVTANTTPDMKVDISAGEIIISGSSVTVSAVNDEAVDAAHATLDRFDTISVGSNGTVDYTAGTAAANPFPPDLAADHILLAVIFVENNSTTVTSSDILDARIINANSFMKKGMYLKECASGTETNASSTLTVIDTVSFAANEIGANDTVLVELYAKKTGGTNNLNYQIFADGTKILERLTGSRCVMNASIHEGDRTDVNGWYRSESVVEGSITITAGDINVDPTSAWDLEFKVGSSTGDEDFNWCWKVHILRGE